MGCPQICSPPPTYTPFKEYLDLKTNKTNNLLTTALQTNTSLGWATAGRARMLIVPNFSSGGRGIER